MASGPMLGFGTFSSTTLFASGPTLGFGTFSSSTAFVPWPRKCIGPFGPQYCGFHLSSMKMTTNRSKTAQEKAAMIQKAMTKRGGSTKSCGATIPATFPNNTVTAVTSAVHGRQARIQDEKRRELGSRRIGGQSGEHRVSDHGKYAQNHEVPEAILVPVRGVCGNNDGDHAEHAERGLHGDCRRRLESERGNHSGGVERDSIHGHGDQKSHSREKVRQRVLGDLPRFGLDPGGTMRVRARLASQPPLEKLPFVARKPGCGIGVVGHPKPSCNANDDAHEALNDEEPLPAEETALAVQLHDPGPQQPANGKGEGAGEVECADPFTTLGPPVPERQVIEHTRGQASLRIAVVSVNRQQRRLQVDYLPEPHRGRTEPQGGLGKKLPPPWPPQ